MTLRAVPRLEHILQSVLNAYEISEALGEINRKSRDGDLESELFGSTGVSRLVEKTFGEISIASGGIAYSLMRPVNAGLRVRTMCALEGYGVLAALFVCNVLRSEDLPVVEKTIAELRTVLKIREIATWAAHAHPLAYALGMAKVPIEPGGLAEAILNDKRVAEQLHERGIGPNKPNLRMASSAASFLVDLHMRYGRSQFTASFLVGVAAARGLPDDVFQSLEDPTAILDTASELMEGVPPGGGPEWNLRGCFESLAMLEQVHSARAAWPEGPGAVLAELIYEERLTWSGLVVRPVTEFLEGAAIQARKRAKQSLGTTLGGRSPAMEHRLADLEGET